MDVIKKIDQLKTERGWNDYTLASKSGLSSSTIANMHRRETVPSVATLEMICNGFGLTLSQFFNEDNRSMPVSDEQADVLKKWTRLTDSQKHIVNNIMDEFLKE